MYVSRFTQPSASQVKTLYMPSLAMAVQGEKAIAMGRETFPFGASQTFGFDEHCLHRRHMAAQSARSGVRDVRPESECGKAARPLLNGVGRAAARGSCRLVPFPISRIQKVLDGRSAAVVNLLSGRDDSRTADRRRDPATVHAGMR
ncbi:MAG: hypothetical protein C6W55_03850 [Thermobacillus sp.]|uniref:hypothetical protein n=1 Tax=Thermobacillus sp. TaxID=2108467 RepID=UPI000E36E678|nr:MAG: hypothetical protein C6W55_03850 [Thermobacillus sp.]